MQQYAPTAPPTGGQGTWQSPVSGQGQFVQGSFDMPTSTVELTIRCSDLEDRDITSKSDPICVMFQSASATNHQWYEVGRTEVIKDTLAPAWTHKFIVNYSFEERQPVKFEVYDWDGDNHNLQKHDFLGKCETTLGQIVSTTGKQFVSVLKGLKSHKRGKIFVIPEELSSSKEEVRFEFRAEKLDKKDFFGKSDPFLIISKGSSTGQWCAVHKTEVIMSNLNPTWKPFELSVKQLCNGNYDRRLKFEVYDWDSDGGHDYIGSFTTCLAELKGSGTSNKTFQVINEKKKTKKGDKYKNSGVVFCKSCSIYAKPSFLDYLQGGTSMNFSVAVDFTASNGHPQKESSLHYINPTTQENQYTTAIRSVGEIIQDYDTDKQFPALGFGAKVPPHFQVAHEFFLNLRQDNNPYCAGVDGLLAAYRTSLQNVQLYGPTNFSPVINHVANFARAYQMDGRQYFVLLILTDGIITDMENTISAIVQASSLPMSVIIIGIGTEDFSAMEALDADNQILKSGGISASRDIVQFVELRKFLTGPTSWNKEALAKEVLAEIPDQLVKWMLSRGIKPLNV